jgi:Superinfection immunity protein
MSTFAFRIAVAVLLTTMVVLLIAIGVHSGAPNPLSGLGGKLAIGIAMSIYFLPAIIAGFRNHHNTAAILILNLLLGWTGIGWIASLVWSATNR